MSPFCNSFVLKDKSKQCSTDLQWRHGGNTSIPFLKVMKSFSFPVTWSNDISADVSTANEVTPVISLDDAVIIY